MWMNPARPVLGLKEWMWVSAGQEFCLFHAGDTRSRTELIAQLGETFEGVISSDDYSVYNGYPVKAQQKCLAHLRRHFKKLISVGTGNNPVLGQAFLELIDEAFAQHRHWRQTQDVIAYQTWAEGNKSESHPEHPTVDRSSWVPSRSSLAIATRQNRTVVVLSRAFQKSHRTSTWQSDLPKADICLKPDRYV